VLGVEAAFVELRDSRQRRSKRRGLSDRVLAAAIA
jgi:hypothetical protein